MTWGFHHPTKINFVMMKNFLFSYYRSLLVFLIIFFASTIPAEEVQKVTWFTIPNLDKMIHLGMYFLFSSVLIFEMLKVKTSYSFQRILIVSGLIALIYGTLLEIIQITLTSSRSGEIFDMVFNAVGVLLAIVLWIFLRKPK